MEKFHGTDQRQSTRRIAVTPRPPVEIVFADTDALRTAHFRLRHQVYCVRKGYEAGVRCAYPDEERDEWDASSRHLLARCTVTGAWVGATRLVLPRTPRLPIEIQCPSLATRLTEVDRRRVGEFSRLCVTTPQNEAANAPAFAAHVVAQLIGAAHWLSREVGLTHWYYLARPSLQRLLRRIHIEADPIGPSCSHYGTRLPFLVDHAREIFQPMARGRPDLVPAVNDNDFIDRTSETGRYFLSDAFNQHAVPAWGKASLPPMPHRTVSVTPP